MSANQQALLMAGAGGATLPTPIFFAPLTHSLTPTIAGAGTPTFGRSTAARVHGVAPAGNAADGLVVLACDAHEARFHGARRVSSGVWSATYADGSAIPAANLLGYVVEVATSNPLLQSQTFDDATWTKENGTITANAQVAPDGTTTADTFTDDATSGVHRVWQGSLAPSSNDASFSVYVKQGTLPWVQLFINDPSFGNTRWANFNLATGAVGNKDGSTTTLVETLGNGWFRFSISSNVSTGFLSEHIYGISTDQNAGAPSYVGTGQTMYLWGAQHDRNLWPSSYIPTTSGPVARNADDLSYALAGNFSSATGSAYAECTWASIQLVSITPAPLWLTSEGTFPLRYGTSNNSLRMTSSAGEVVTANLRVAGTPNKQASAWSGSTASICLNAGTVGTGAFGTYTTSGVFVVGGNDASRVLRGSIRNVKLWNVRLTNAELVAATT